MDQSQHALVKHVEQCVQYQQQGMSLSEAYQRFSKNVVDLVYNGNEESNHNGERNLENDPYYFSRNEPVQVGNILFIDNRPQYDPDRFDNYSEDDSLRNKNPHMGFDGKFLQLVPMMAPPPRKCHKENQIAVRDYDGRSNNQTHKSPKYDKPKEKHESKGNNYQDHKGTQWCWKEGPDSWKPYERQINNKIEQGYLSNKPVTIVIEGREYKITFSDMKQRDSRNSTKSRDIRRGKPEPESKHDSRTKNATPNCIKNTTSTGRWYWYDVDDRNRLPLSRHEHETLDFNWSNEVYNFPSIVRGQPSDINLWTGFVTPLKGHVTMYQIVREY